MKKGLFLGAGLAIATAAGAYFLYGKDGRKSRKKIVSWSLKAKAEVLERIERIKHVDQKTYHKVIDTVAKRYSKMKRVNAHELSRLIRELKGYWKHIEKGLARKRPKSRS